MAEKIEEIVLEMLESPDMFMFYAASPVRGEFFPMKVRFPNQVIDTIQVNVVHVHGVSYFIIAENSTLKVLKHCKLPIEPIDKLWDLYLATEFDTHPAPNKDRLPVFPHYLKLYFLPRSKDSYPAPYIALPLLPRFLTRTLQHVSQLLDIVPQQPGLSDRRLALLVRRIGKVGREVQAYRECIQVLCWLIQTTRLAKPTKLEFSDELTNNGFQMIKQLFWLNRPQAEEKEHSIDGLLELAGSPLSLHAFANEDKIGSYLALAPADAKTATMPADFTVTDAIMQRIKGVSI